MECALGGQPVLAEKVAVVGTENNERVVGNAQMIQRVQYAAYFSVHQADHTVVDSHVFAHCVGFMQVAVEAVIAVGRLLPGGEVRLTLLRFGEVGWHCVEFSRLQVARLHVVGVVHRCPRLGYEVGRMGIVEAAPKEERFAVGGATLDGRDRAIGCPDGVVVLLGQIPGVFPLGRIGVGRPGLEEVLPVGEAVFLHPDSVVLTGMGFVGVVARYFDVLKSVPGAVELAPEVKITQGGLTLERGLFRT